MTRALAQTAALVLLVIGCSRPEAPRNTAITRDAHQINFPINDDGGVHNVDCNICHGTTDSFAQYTCTNGCHNQVQTDSAHGLIYDAGAGLGIELAPGYGQYDPNGQTCFNCHPNGLVPAGVGCVQDGGAQQGACFDHTPFFRIRPGQADFANNFGPHDGCSMADVYAFRFDAGVDLNVDSAGLPFWLTNVGYGVVCPPYPGEGGIVCAACHPDPNDHRTYSCLTCHPLSGLLGLHDAGVGNGYVPVENGPIGCAGAYGCHKGGSLGVRN